MEKAIFNLIDVAHYNLATEFPRVHVKNIVTCVQNGGNDLAENVEEMIRDSISCELKSTKKMLLSKLNARNFVSNNLYILLKYILIFMRGIKIASH